MNKEFIKEQVQEILDKNHCTFQGGNEANIHSCYDIAELFEKQFLEKEKEIIDLKAQLVTYQLRGRANYGFID